MRQLEETNRQGYGYRWVRSGVTGCEGVRCMVVGVKYV